MLFGAMIKNALAMVLVVNILSSCSVPFFGGGGLGSNIEIDYSPNDSVSQDEAVRIAESFRSMRWSPEVKNMFHGKDKDGIIVNTPDTTLKEKLPSSTRPGWWKPGVRAIGMPYQWGGFDTPSSFQNKLAKGYYAGDVYTKSKRSLLYSGVSNRACGIDCSGFVSRCWRLSKAYSTRELEDICVPLASYDDLQKADILNLKNAHVLLFVKWLDKKKTIFLAYETGSPPSWKVLRHPISVNYVKALGFKPFRYAKMKED